MTDYKTCCDRYDYDDCRDRKKDYDYDDYRDRKKDNDYDDYRRRKDSKPVFPVTVLNCGTGTGTSLSILANESNNLGFVPQVVGSVNLDTRGLKKVTKKIEFSSVINFQTTEFERDFFITLVFQLSAVCNGSSKIPLGTWTYEKNLNFENQGNDQTWTIKDPFSFVWCECDDCPDCCRYIVEIVDFRYNSIASVSVTNVGISALAAGTPC